MASQATGLQILSPIGGISRKVGYQSQPPFTTYDSTNFWPIDVSTGRSVSATRPAFVTATAPSGTVFNMLERVNGVAVGKPLESMVLAVDGQVYWWDGTTWQAATGAGAASMETTRSLYAATFLQKTYIPQFGGKPWVFDYVNGTVEELVESEGTIPDDLRVFAVWQGALWAAGSLVSPNILHASRVGDATDWDFAAPITDEGGAFFTGGENEGKLRGPITAVMPHTSDTMIVSTTEGLVAFRGHPRQGGVIEDIGGAYVLGQGAWCKTDKDVMYFLTRLGMMKLDPVPGAVPTQISRQKIPDELVGLAYDFENPNIEVEYDQRWDCIYITVRGASSEAWMFDTQTGGFHRMTLPNYPYRMVQFFPFVNADQSGVLFAGDDLYQFDRTGSENFSANLLVGPFRISPSTEQKAKIVRSQFVFVGDTPSVDGTISFHTGPDGEDTIDRVTYEEPQFTVGLRDVADNNGVCHPQVSGAACTIEFDIENGRLALDEITVNLHAAGVNRMTRMKVGKTICQAYVTNTPEYGPEEDLADGLEIVNLNSFPQEWWDLANADGSNVRVTDENNNFLPFDINSFEKFDTDGMSRLDRGSMVIRRPLPSTPTPVRCWVCDANLAKFPVGAEFGQYNTYPPWAIGFWPGFGDSRGREPLRLDPGDFPEDTLQNPFHPDHPEAPGTLKVVPGCSMKYSELGLDDDPLWGGITGAIAGNGALVFSSGGNEATVTCIGGYTYFDPCERFSDPAQSPSDPGVNSIWFFYPSDPSVIDFSSAAQSSQVSVLAVKRISGNFSYEIIGDTLSDGTVGGIYLPMTYSIRSQGQRVYGVGYHQTGPAEDPVRLGHYAVASSTEIPLGDRVPKASIGRVATFPASIPTNIASELSSIWPNILSIVKQSKAGHGDEDDYAAKDGLRVRASIPTSNSYAGPFVPSGVLGAGGELEEEEEERLDVLEFFNGQRYSSHAAEGPEDANEDYWGAWGSLQNPGDTLLK